MRIFSKIFICLCALTALVAVLFAYQINSTFKAEFRKATEEPLVDLSRILTGIVTLSLNGQAPSQDNLSKLNALLSYIKTHPLEARIYDLTKMSTDLQIYITDHEGKVLFHSNDPLAIGKDFSQWNDVHTALQKRSGARTTREANDPNTSILYISTPIILSDKVAGVVAVGKSAHTTNALVSAAKRNVWLVVLAILGGIFLLSYLISRNIVRPIEELTQYANAVALGQKVSVPTCHTLELKTMGAAFEKMKTALQGKEYVERYVQTLAHELKTPLFAIKGAVEILTPSIGDTPNKRFITNIDRETWRLELIIQDLMLLASLERERHETKIEEVNLEAFLNERLELLAPLASKRELTIKLGGETKDFLFTDGTFLAHAFDNLLKNALEFAEHGSTINVHVLKKPHAHEISLINVGPKIPDYALPRIFERFYSLPRDTDGRKSSGLGLCIAKEACEIIGATLTVSNLENGVRATIVL